MRRLGWLLIILGAIGTGAALVELIDPLACVGTLFVAVLGVCLVADEYERDLRRRPGYIIDDPSRRER